LRLIHAELFDDDLLDLLLNRHASSRISLANSLILPGEGGGLQLLPLAVPILRTSQKKAGR
jgi:hypothetical protein